MAQGFESGEQGDAGDPEVFEGLVTRAMLTVANRIELERKLALVERLLATFPDGIVAEALRRVGVVDSEPEAGSVTDVIPEQDAPMLPRPRLEVD